MNLRALALLLVPAALAGGVTVAADWPQWGRDPSKNMVAPADEKGLPTQISPGVVDENTGKLDLKDAKNVKWAVKLGTYAFGNPTVANGRILVGTNNENPRDPKIKGDYSVLW